jgi:outer membrane autotransporter protein
MSAAQGASNDAVDGPQGFATVGYGNIHHQTGSSVAVEGHHLIAGLTLGKRFSTSRLTTAAFLEYGNTTYQGLGMLARSDFDNGMHVEGSVRAGEVSTDYRSNDLRDSLGKRAEYDTKNGYVGAHVGIGKTWTLTERDTFDVYTRGLWTRQGKDGTTLSTGERLEFDKIDSKRLQLGIRYEHTLNSGIQAYTGFAYDREYNGEAKVTTNGTRIDAPNLKGNTGIGEIGLKATPRPGQPFHLDFGLQGYTGKQEGITGSFRMRYFF